MFTEEKQLYIAHCDNGPLYLVGKMANRHGLIAGATGTGKTVTLQVIAESFSQAGVPCFMADMKGDLSGISQAGKMSGFIEKRMSEFFPAKDLDGEATSNLSTFTSDLFHGCPTRFFDVFGEQGHPLRATISDMGPQLLARLLGLNDTQTGVLNIVFKIADDRGLLLIDMKDLRLMLDYVAKNAKEFTTTYGNISAVSVGAIQRALLALETEGADKFFGEPAFNVFDFLQTEGGRGIMNVLAADKLMLNPKLYSTFLLWLLSELYTQLPEVGDLELPKLVFFFDEAHMLFKDTSKALVDKIEQVIRLVRSKGVGVYFVTQSPDDIPEAIAGQLGNRVLHGLRAYTPKEQKAVRAAAQTFRTNPSFNTENAILELGTGEALVSFLDEKGAPSIVERAKILFPLSQIGAITDEQRQSLIRQSRLYGTYEKIFDRESAYEVLVAEQQQAEKRAQKEAEEEAKRKEKEAKEKEKAKASKTSSKKKSTTRKAVEKTINTTATTFGRQLGKSIFRSILGGIFK
jgi:DNA helicase HerA-like ATPase